MFAGFYDRRQFTGEPRPSWGVRLTQTIITLSVVLTAANFFG